MKLIDRIFTRKPRKNPLHMPNNPPFEEEFSFASFKCFRCNCVYAYNIPHKKVDDVIFCRWCWRVAYINADISKILRFVYGKGEKVLGIPEHLRNSATWLINNPKPPSLESVNNGDF
jgi:hypothetical protein